MSKQNNLTDFLTDVADAIRSKKGTTDLINPQNFSAEIAALSGGLEVIEMTETTATIEPNKVYVWGMVESLNITLGASTDESDFFAFRFRCSKPTMTVVTVNGATWADDTELDTQGKPVLDLGSWYQCEIKGGTSALYARLAHYIPFEDSNVEAVLMSNGIGDGIGITYADAAKVTTISTWFKSNAEITSFDELQHFGGMKVLEKNAFQNCSALTEIAFPASLISIGDNAFNGCKSLLTASGLGETQVTTIGTSAFQKCSAFTEITLPVSLISIGNYAFSGCSALTEVANLENTSITTIGLNMFHNCSLLQSITVPSTITSIQNSAFNACSALTEVANLENTAITTIGTSGFEICKSLKRIALPSTITSIGNYAFSGCSALTEVANLENTSITTIGLNMFYNCSLLQSITVPSTITSIQNSAFSACSALTEVANLENTAITTIGTSGFEICKSLKRIALPSTITSIGNYAFSGCSALTYIVVKATTPPTLASTKAIPSTIGAIYVPDESVAAYQAATNWRSFASKIKGISEMPAE